MSSIEERLIADIAAVAGGVVVTDSDLRDAHESMHDRIENKRKHDRRRSVIGAAAAAVVAIAVGASVLQALDDDDRTAPPADQPSNPVDPDADFLTGQPPTPELIEGVWRVDNGTELILFNIDGTLQYDSSGQLYSSPSTTGTYEIDEGVIKGTITTGTAECVGRTFSIRASLLPIIGEMRIAYDLPMPGGCAPGPEFRTVLEHVLPMGTVLSGLKVDASGDWQPPEGPQSLHGVWMAEFDQPMVELNGGGFVLELAPDGTYMFVTTGDLIGRTASGATVAVVNRGTWSLNGTRLTFDSEGGPNNPDTGNPVCDNGERFVMTAVAIEPGSAVAMRGTFDENACASRWAPTTWLLFPHDPS